MISIHAPRVGCDSSLMLNTRQISISIHAPRVGCDEAALTGAGIYWEFQSTHPVWGATPTVWGPGRQKENISIHAPRVGCDLQRAGFLRIHTKFQSTHPVWGATSSPVWMRLFASHFNPRTPCGVRHVHVRPCGLVKKFQSTHPVWGATGDKQRADELS